VYGEKLIESEKVVYAHVGSPAKHQGRTALARERLVQ